jgi:hypothetical protein
MTLASEEAVKKALGISSFRELSREKMLAFAAAMPDMANEVRLKLIEQLPSFQKFALDAVSTVERTFDSTLLANEHSQDQATQAFAEVRGLIKGELDRDDLDEDHRQFLIQSALSTAESQALIDSENKHFLAGQLKTVGATAAVAITAAIVLVGGRLMIGGEES